MKVWKRLLGIALCLCMALCVIGVRGDATSGSEHSHPICGATHKDIGDHTGTCDSVTWTAWDGTSAIQYDETTKTAYVYLSGETTLADTLEVTSGHTLYLCLNGKTLNAQYTVISVKGNATLNICDCQGSGKITNTSKSNSLIKVDPDYKGTATLNLYGGKVSGSVNSDGAVMLYNNAGDQKDNTAIFNMYGGEVCNTGSGIYVSFSRVGTGFFGVNIYGGTVASENTYGIDSSDSSNATVLVAGGEIKGYLYAIRAIGNLKLSGSPLIHADEDEADIGIITASASTLNDYITVADDFAPAEGTKVSVEKSVDSSGSVLIAKPAAGASLLSSKAQYFVSAEEGYFVESKNGELYLTACAITEEPAVGNGYTVTANGSPTYQWYSATKGPVPVTENIVERKGSLSYYWYGEWSTYSIPQSGEVTGFTLTMKAGDVLTLDFSRSDVWVERVAFSDGQRTITGVEDEDHWQTYTLTAPADGDYTLTISASAEPMGGEPSHTKLSFTATVTAYVPGAALDGQTDPQLDTSKLGNGSYICLVTWEGNTTLNSQAVTYSHQHIWSTDWTTDDNRHWHKCSACNETKDEAEHSWDTGMITTPATCTEAGLKTYTCSVCSAKKFEHIDAAGHDPVSHEAKAPTCTEIGWNAYVTCSRCNYTTYAVLPASGHDWADATCTEPRTCSVCQSTDGEALGHDWGAWFVTTPATTEWYGTAARSCRRDPSHTETRLIPKLAPEPSDGCKKDGDCPLAAYPDLAATAWYHDGIHYCLENGLMQGVPGGAFQPGGDTTRAQLVTILWRQEGCPAVKGEIGFRDVRDGAWYADAVRWAAVEGIMRGYDGRFAPDDTVSREQMATVLYRYAKYKGADVNADGGADISGFADGAAVSRYAGPAMEWAYGNGLVSGVPQDGGTVLAPKDTTTRAQMAVLMMRFYTELMK